MFINSIYKRYNYYIKNILQKYIFYIDIKYIK